MVDDGVIIDVTDMTTISVNKDRTVAVISPIEVSRHARRAGLSFDYLMIEPTNRL